MHWQAYVYDKRDGVLVCGEINHVKHLFWKYAWGLMVRRDLKVAVKELAHRVGVEYLGE